MKLKLEKKTEEKRKKRVEKVINKIAKKLGVSREALDCDWDLHVRKRSVVLVHEDTDEKKKVKLKKKDVRSIWMTLLADAVD